MPETITLDAPAGTATLAVLDKFSGEVIAEVTQHSPEDGRQILREAVAVARTQPMPRHVRVTVLQKAATLLEDRADEFAALIVREAGKTIRQARKEVGRAANTLRLSAAEAGQNVGHVLPLDAFAGAAGRTGWYSREPLGVVFAITPYNDPLNLVAHKLGPAIAGGNTVVLKPSQLTPLTAQKLVDLLHEAGLPAERLVIIRGNRLVAQELITSRDVRMISFTGGFRTAEAIAGAAGIKRLSMELGGNAPVLVFDDADIDEAVAAIVSGGFWAAGQNCIGAQRILVASDIAEAFTDRLVAATAQLVAGDPTSEQTDVGPMISPEAAAEARDKIDDALAQGARLLTGGHLNGAVLSPAVLTDVPRGCTLWADEVFAPIVIVEAFRDENAAIAAANDGAYALQAGVFTSDVRRAMRVADAIDAGGVMINDSSDFRLDAMPFGGTKYGSMGREGVSFAYEEMTQPKVVVLS